MTKSTKLSPEWFGDRERLWCKHAGYLAHIELLPVRQEYAWIVEDIRMKDSDDIEPVASGVAGTIDCAKEIATGFLRDVGALRVVRHRARKESNVIDLFPAGVCVETDPAD